MEQRHATGRNGTARGTPHPAIDVMLHHFVQRCRTARHQANTQKACNKPQLSEGTPALRRTEEVSTPGGDDNERSDAQFCELSVVAQAGYEVTTGRRLSLLQE